MTAGIIIRELMPLNHLLTMVFEVNCLSSPQLTSMFAVMPVKFVSALQTD